MPLSVWRKCIFQKPVRPWPDRSDWTLRPCSNNCLVLTSSVVYPFRHTDDVGLPAHERYQHLVDGLELPHHYRVLAEKFRCVDTIVSLMKNRKETCTFTRLKGGVEQMCRR